MLETLQQADLQALLTLNSLHSPYWDKFMWIITGKLTWIPMYATIVYIIFKNFSLRLSLLTVVTAVLTIVYADSVCAKAIRPQIERSRPSQLGPLIQKNDAKAIRLMESLHQEKDLYGQYPIEKIHLHEKSPGDFYRGGRFGFPSCHSSNSFALAFFVLLLFRKRWLSWFILCWAVLNSYSRIYLGVHFPGDIIAGMFVGLSGALLLYYIFRALLRQPRIERFLQESPFHSPVFHTSEIRYTNLTIWVGLATIAATAIYAGI